MYSFLCGDPTEVDLQYILSGTVVTQIKNLRINLKIYMFCIYFLLIKT